MQRGSPEHPKATKQVTSRTDQLPDGPHVICGDMLTSHRTPSPAKVLTPSPQQEGMSHQQNSIEHGVSQATRARTGTTIAYNVLQDKMA